MLAEQNDHRRLHMAAKLLSVVMSLTAFLVIGLRDQPRIEVAMPTTERGERAEAIIERVQDIQRQVAGMEHQARKLDSSSGRLSAETISRRLAGLERRWLDRYGMTSAESELHDRIAMASHHRAKIMDPQTTAVARAESYFALTRLKSGRIEFDSEVWRHWLRDVYSESSDPTVSRYLAMSAGPFGKLEDVALGMLHLLRSNDPTTRTKAVANLSRFIGHESGALADAVRAELRRVAVYDPSRKVREKASTELSSRPREGR